MSKSIKLKNDVYLDTSGIVHGTEPLIESGTWTPELACLNETAPTVTYTGRIGKYFKIADMVYITFVIRGNITALNGTNNFSIIKGLPFMSRITQDSDYIHSISLGQLYNATTVADGVTASATKYGVCLRKSNGTTINSWKKANGIYIDGGGWYRIK